MYDLNKIVEQIREFDIKTKALVNSLKNFKELKSKINNSNFDKLKIVGVDGGFIRKEFHGASFALCRGVAVYFEYENGTLIKTSYFPEKKPNFRLIPIDINLPERDANLFCNLIREKIELETCINALEVFEPDILIRDGSIILYPGSLPSKESQIYSLYEEIMSLVKVLYEKSFLKNTLLCGAVEDSRGKRFCNFLKNFTNLEILEKLVDTVLLYYFLEAGERTKCLNYSEKLETPIITDLGPFSNHLFLTYLKILPYDRPLRIDFLSKPEKKEEIAEKITSIIFAISKQYKTYAYPSILIEADSCAKLKEGDILTFKKMLNKKIEFNPFFFDLRRESRPY